MSIKIGQSLDLGNNQITNVGAPSAATDVATKNYVDATVQGLKWKASVRAASVGNVTLATPGSALDGVTLTNGDRVLLKDQTTGAQNGIYIWTGAATALTRANDADSAAELEGMAVTVTQGTTNGDRVFVIVTDPPITLGTTALAYTQLGGGGAAYTAGNGLSLSGVDFSVNVGTGLTIIGDVVQVDTNVVVRKVAATIGNGVLTSFTVAHNLGTRDVEVTVYNFDGAGVYDDTLVEVHRPDANSVTLVFGSAPASNGYRVVVVG